MITPALYINSQRIKKDGTATLYIRVTINRKREYINLGFDWPADLVDTASNIFLPRFKGDLEHSDFSIMVNQELGKINEIFRLARLAGRELDIDQFKDQYYNYQSREDFCAYWLKKVQYRFDSGIIRKITYVNHLSSLNTLKLFKKVVPFSTISRKFLEEYKAFMYSKMNYDSDTALTKLKNLRTYLNQAKADEIIFEYPFATGFKMPKEQGRLVYLDEDEFIKFKKHFQSGVLSPGTNKEKAARCFLFMCYTGVRLGDFQQLTHKNISYGVLTYAPSKATKDNQKVIETPLHPYAKKLIITKKGKLFNFPSSETKMRQMLAEIADKLNISYSCNPHSARHTFATRFLRCGGRLEVLKELLGHEDLKTTLVYTHVDLDRKKEEMALLT